MSPRKWVEKFVKWMGEWKVDPVVLGPILFLILLWVVDVWDSDAVSGALAAVIFFSPIWLTVFLFVAFWTVWIHYIRFAFWFEQGHILLQIELPPEVEKTPLAMELFLASLWNSGGETTFIQRVWKGSYRPVWSLEIASNEGRIHYYLHLREGWRNTIESRLYGQFPEAKVTVVEDYASRVPFNLNDYSAFGSEYKKTSGVAEALPIRTYIDYGLHMAPDKPETQVDPITNTLELLGSIGKDEHFWMQIICKARKKDEWYGFYREGWFKKDSYVDGAKAEIQKITKDAIARAQLLTEDEMEKKKVGTRGAMLLNEIERERVAAIERNLTKLVFECGVRTLYLAKKDKYVGINNASIIRFFDAYRKPDYNALGVTRGTSYFDYPWQDFAEIRKNKERRHLYFRYRHRAYFYVPYDQEPVMMTTEELASLWHFPSSVVKTPALSRVPSRRADAPSNLPTGEINLPG